MIPALPCARRLNVRGIGKCRHDVYRFRFSCLFCRMRRFWRGTFTLPSSYIEYTYTSFCYTKRRGNLIQISYPYVLVDPRGHFTKIRVAAIRVIDKLMLRLRRTKPLIEAAEFLANYPTW